MKTTALTAMMMMASGSVVYAGRAAPKPTVVVCAPAQMDREFENAQTLASTMFDHIGVTLDWRHADHCC